MRQLSILLSILVINLLACNQSADTGQGDESSHLRPLNRDSLRQVYERVVKDRTNLMPKQQIVEPGKIYPVDEGLTDTGFFVFREYLLKIIEQRDEIKLLEMVAQNVKGKAPGDDNLAAFVEYWQLDAKKDDSELWSVLPSILSGGGIFDANRQKFTAPYYVATFPDNYEKEIFGVITGEGVRVRAATNLNSQILKTISYDIVQILGQSAEKETIGSDTYPWVKVKLSDGKEGYVYGKYIGTPTDLSATFTRKSGARWLLTALQ